MLTERSQRISELGALAKLQVGMESGFTRAEIDMKKTQVSVKCAGGRQCSREHTLIGIRSARRHEYGLNHLQTLTKVPGFKPNAGRTVPPSQ